MHHSHNPTSADFKKLSETCDPCANARAWLEGQLSGITPGEISTTWAKLHLAVHGTTLQRALSIINDGRIYAHKGLEAAHPEVPQARLHNATDKLDIQIGFDRYVFLSLGRIHPYDIHPVYFIFPNRVTTQAGTLVALKEIVHCGGLVSPEAVQYYRLATGDRSINVERTNYVAAQRFFQQLFEGETFREEIFSRFLEKYFSRIHSYWSDILYPGDKLKPLRVGNEISINGWEGPQVTVPGEILLSDYSPSILVTSLDPGIIAAIRHSGFPIDRIYTMAEALPVYNARYPMLASYQNSQQDRGIFIHLALRDLALLKHHNELNRSFPENMVAFAQRG